MYKYLEELYKNYILYDNVYELPARKYENNHHNLL